MSFPGTSPRPRRSARRFILLGACLGLPWACARVAFREAMQDVEQRYVILFDEFENGSNFAARDAARDLKAAFRAPAIAEDAPGAETPDFQRFIDETIATLDRIEEEASRFTADGPANLRSELSARCDACHDRFRAADT